MTPSGNTFREYCVEGIKKFVQTAVVIDDEAFFASYEDDSEAGAARTATRTPGSVMEPVTPSVESRVASPATEGKASDEAANTGGSPLDAKAITDAFHGIQVICGLYKPSPEEDAADLATKAAQHADIVILDWFLDKKNHNSEKAKQVIRSILIRDLAEHGRLRLIVIYTGEPGVAGIARDVFDFLDSDEVLSGRFSLAESGQALFREDARICFLNKRSATIGAGSDTVVEKELPERLMREFAYVTEGVLSTFAVNAIAAVRRSSNHVVALFRKELDGAYVAHRCRLVEPEDAKEFALELIAEELRNVIATADIAESCMGGETLGVWIDHLSAKGQLFKNHINGDTVYSADDVKRLLTTGYEKMQPRLPGLKPRDIEGLFFQTRADSGLRSLEFARLSNLKREPEGRNRHPDEWVPVLTMGSILKVLRVRPETKESYGLHRHLTSDYLVCVQPRCDSVRLDGETSFPFQSASINNQYASISKDKRKFNLVVKDDQTEGTMLLVGWKPLDTIVIRFTPAEPGQSIHATRNGLAFEFEDALRRKYLWLGDLKDMNVQRDASELARRIHTPGIDSNEWLRVASQDGQIDFEARYAE